MESCCVEEFFPSAEIEGIWGFTRAIAMVGGVSLVIFFSLFKRTDLELKKKKLVKMSDKRTMPLQAVCRMQISGYICRNHIDVHEKRKVWTRHRGFSTLGFYSLCLLSAASKLPEVWQTQILSQGFSLLCSYFIAGIIVSTSTSWSPVRHLTKKSLIILHPSAHITRVKTPSDGFLEHGATHSRSVRHEICSACQILLYMCCTSAKLLWLTLCLNASDEVETIIWFKVRIKMIKLYRAGPK